LEDAFPSPITGEGTGGVGKTGEFCNKWVRHRVLSVTYYGRFEARLEQRLAEGIGALRNEKHAGFGALRADMTKWMFTFWAGSAVTTVATVWGVVSLLR
jgi:hypothetical protein